MSNDKAYQPKKFRCNGSVEKLHETKFQVIEIVIRCDMDYASHRGAPFLLIHIEFIPEIRNMDASCQVRQFWTQILIFQDHSSVASIIIIVAIIKDIFSSMGTWFSFLLADQWLKFDEKKKMQNTDLLIIVLYRLIIILHSWPSESKVTKIIERMKIIIRNSKMMMYTMVLELYKRTSLSGQKGELSHAITPLLLSESFRKSLIL